MEGRAGDGRAGGWPRVDRRELRGPFDIVGDVHGCADELEALLSVLGYDVGWQGEPGLRSYRVTPPAGRTAVFLGDLCDRGPRIPDVVRLVGSMTQAGAALCVRGNHDDKALRWMQGSDVRIAHGLERTIAQLEEQPRGFRGAMRELLQSLGSHHVLDGGRLVVSHAGLREHLHYDESRAARGLAIYGEHSDVRDAAGRAVRDLWAHSYAGGASVVYGHASRSSAGWLNRTLCLDTGCVYGGNLTALRWPEMELVAVPAREAYAQRKEPL